MPSYSYLSQSAVLLHTPFYFLTPFAVSDWASMGTQSGLSCSPSCLTLLIFPLHILRHWRHWFPAPLSKPGGERSHVGVCTWAHKHTHTSEGWSHRLAAWVIYVHHSWKIPTCGLLQAWIPRQRNANIQWPWKILFSLELYSFKEKQGRGDFWTWIY